MRFFTTEGPVNCQDHYCLPPLARFDLEDVMALIAQKKYFLLHAPRQTGKSWEERLWRRAESYRSLPITVWGM
jgi:hypothetical protein